MYSFAGSSSDSSQQMAAARRQAVAEYERPQREVQARHANGHIPFGAGIAGCPNPLSSDLFYFGIDPELYFLEQGHSDVHQDWYSAPSGPSQYHPIVWTDPLRGQPPIVPFDGACAWWTDTAGADRSIFSVEPENKTSTSHAENFGL